MHEFAGLAQNIGRDIGKPVQLDGPVRHVGGNTATSYRNPSAHRRVRGAVQHRTRQTRTVGVMEGGAEAFQDRIGGRSFVMLCSWPERGLEAGNYKR